MADLLDGVQPRPKLRGSRRSSGQLASGSSKFLQHHLIVTAIDILATKGYRPTRRDYYTHGETCCLAGGSVFDAVGVAFGKPDRALGYKEGRGALDGIHETREALRTPARTSAPGTPRPKKTTLGGGWVRTEVLTRKGGLLEPGPARRPGHPDLRGGGRHGVRDPPRRVEGRGRNGSGPNTDRRGSGRRRAVLTDSFGQRGGVHTQAATGFAPPGQIGPALP